MGQAARKTFNRLNLTWPRIVEALLASVLSPRGDRGNSAEMKRNAPCPCGSGKRYKHCHGRYN
jgi:preprotein translocase subunit SecA